MSGKVTIRLETDPACRETEVIIRSSRHTQLTESIISAVERCVEREYPPVAAYQGDMLVLIAQNDIARICTENRKLTIFAASGRYTVKMPLKELEETLDRDQFVRISRFEIVNLRKITGFDFSSTGTIRVLFTDGSETWVARRYVQSIQQTLKDRTVGREV